MERIRREWARPVLSAFASAAGAAAFSCAMAAPAQAQSNACISDTELDAAVGDQVRSGSFTIDTSKLREAPMCSGITVAQAIQRIAEDASPRARPAAAPAAPALPVDQAAQVQAAQPLTGGGTGAGPNLDGFLRFSTPSECGYGPAIITFLSDLVDYPAHDPADKPSMGKVTVPAAVRPVVGAPKQHRFADGLEISVPIRGQWLGIPVVALHGLYWNGGDTGGFSIVMKGAFQDVRGKLNRGGFNIPSSGNRVIPGDYEMEISLTAEGDQVTLTCI